MQKSLNLFTTKFYHYLRSNKTVFIALTGLFLFVRLIGLGHDMSNSDALRWHRRSEKFLTAVKTLDFKSTYQHYQPGVTLMWLNALTKQSVFWIQLFYTNEPNTLENSDWFPVIDGISKGVIITVLGVLFWLQLRLVSKLFSQRTAYIYGFIVIFEPYLLGIDRWFHVTSLEAYFGFTALLYLLYAVNNDGSVSKKIQNHQIFFSALLFTFAFLSKVTVLILFPLFIYALYKRSDLRSLIYFILYCTILSVIIFPALLVSSHIVLPNIFNSIVGGIFNTVRNEKVTGNSLFFYVLVMIFKLSPVLLITVILSIKNFRKQIIENKNIVYIYMYFGIYFLSLTFAGQKIDRYIIPMFLPLILITSLYLTNKKSKILIMYFVLTFVVYAYVSYMTYLVYSAYYSPILGGTKAAIEKYYVYDNSGEYFYQAANYLKKFGRNTNVYVPDNIESFSPYYDGNIQREFTSNTDYIVTSLDYDRWWPDGSPLSMCSKGGAAFGPKDYNVVYVFRCK